MFQWKYSQPIALGWSHQEHLLCIQDDGSVYIHDMFGSYKHMFNIEKEAYDMKVIDAKVFESQQGTGVAILTSAFKVFVVNNVYNVKKRQLSEAPTSGDQPLTAWCVIPGERHTEVLVARSRELYLLREHDCQQLTPDVLHDHTAILEMALSLDGRHLALFTDAGQLWIGSSNLRYKYCETITECVPRPRQLVWCGSDAVALSYGCNVAVFGRRDGEAVTYVYDAAAHLVPEIDGVRVLSAAQHEMMQKVPEVVQKIFRINSTAPGSFLLEASKQYQKRSHRADEYISLVRAELETAVSQCVEAAGYEFDPDTQKMLIRAAQFGKCFIENADPDLYVNMCRRLRVLNAVRDPRIGIPLTCQQALAIGYESLLERLVARKHFYLAIQIARFLRLPDSEGSARILERWAKYKVVQPHLDEDACAREIADKLGYAAGVSFSEIAKTASSGGRNKLAIRLLDYEPRAREQVPLLLELGESRPALVKAIESGDTDLMYTVILSMRENMPLADFRLTIRNYPAAQALYKKYCQEYNPQALQEIHMQEDDHCAQADTHVRESLEPGGALTREASLVSAYELYKRGRSDLHASLCDEAVKLLRVQKTLEQSHSTNLQNLVGCSVHDTCARLLALGDIRAADKLRSDFRIPERRYWWLRIRSLAELSEWTELERFSKSKKSPIGYGPFVDVCLENENITEAMKYLPRVNEDFKIKYYLKAG